MSGILLSPAQTVLDAAARLALHRSMLRIRHVEEVLAAHYGEWEMRCPLHLCIGQEAAEAGAGAALEPGDFAFSGHRAHGHYLAKGGDLAAMVAEIYGKATGCAGGKGGSMHLVDMDAGFLGSTPIVGSTVPMAVGAAMASTLRGDGRVSMAFLGDGATEAGVFHESLNLAMVRRAPVVFVCENNLYSVCSPLGVRQPDGRSIAGLARAHGLATASGDGNDVEESYRLVRAAVDHARAGHGPAFVELSTYRWREHCGPDFDNDIGYRPSGEADAWMARCPVAAHRARLMAAGVVTAAALDALATEALAEAEAAVAAAKAAPWPAAAEGIRHVLA